MTNEHDESTVADDVRHDFQAASYRAGDDAIVDDRGHEFTKGRVSPRDEEDECSSLGA